MDMAEDERFADLAIWLNPNDYSNVLRQHRSSDPSNVASNDPSAFLQKLQQLSRDPACALWFKVFTDAGNHLISAVFCSKTGLQVWRRFAHVSSFDLTFGLLKCNMQAGTAAHCDHHGRNRQSFIWVTADATENTFRNIFGAIAAHQPDVHPGVMFVDECQAQMNALLAKFPHSVLRRCLFHKLQNVQRLFADSMMHSNKTIRQGFFWCAVRYVTTNTWYDVPSISGRSSLSVFQ